MLTQPWNQLLERQNSRQERRPKQSSEFFRVNKREPLLAVDSHSSAIEVTSHKKGLVPVGQEGI